MTSKALVGLGLGSGPALAAGGKKRRASASTSAAAPAGKKGKAKDKAKGTLKAEAKPSKGKGMAPAASKSSCADDVLVPKASMFIPGYLQCTVVRPGASLGAHVDPPAFGDRILTLNIGAIEVTLSPGKGGKQAAALVTQVRSFELYGLSEESRSYAQHAIAEMADQWRIGVTVRYFHIALVELLLLQDRAAAAAAGGGGGGGGGGDGEEDGDVGAGTLVFSQWPSDAQGVSRQYPNIYPATIVSGPSSQGLYVVRFSPSCHNIWADFDSREGWISKTGVKRNQFVTRALVARRWSQDTAGSWTRSMHAPLSLARP